MNRRIRQRREFSRIVERSQNPSGLLTKERLRRHFESLLSEAEEAIRTVVRLGFELPRDCPDPEIEFSLRRTDIGPGVENWAVRHGYHCGSDTPPILSPTITIYIPLSVKRRAGEEPNADGIPESLEWHANWVIDFMRLGTDLKRHDPHHQMACLPFEENSDLFHCNIVFRLPDTESTISWSPPFVYFPRHPVRSEIGYEAVDTKDWCGASSSWFEENRMNES
ncbi:hypothetical protein F4821DRAFT_254219 [Hypoxylon rubiginosum]|uniref:Uncharacterized protein n=1 Tax=Hypoxylon rubiginosum TaxID=110542 RepID=A0ACC0DGY6_9PEZI|nr:hypothetical protein F4821DRAFT_254219 [Hypoxylon rubiginosum]